MKKKKSVYYTWEESLLHSEKQSWNEERGQTQKEVLEKPW